MDKYQYMVIIVGAIFCVLLLIIFGVLVKLTFKPHTVSKVVAPCPDYWEEVKEIRVNNANPNKDFIYKNDTSFVKQERVSGVFTALPDNGANANFVKTDIIGNNSVQGLRIMVNKETPLMRINNEVTKTITACKVPSFNSTNTGKIYKNDESRNIVLRDYKYGKKHNNLRNNYTTLDKIPNTGIEKDVQYDKNEFYYKLYTPSIDLITNGDGIDEKTIIPTPGFYWKTDCMDNKKCLTNSDDANVKIWGKTYSGTAYTPNTFYIDFKNNNWHTYNMQKSQKCNLKDWANKNGIVWDGITNLTC